MEIMVCGWLCKGSAAGRGADGDRGARVLELLALKEALSDDPCVRSAAKAGWWRPTVLSAEPWWRRFLLVSTCFTAVLLLDEL